MVEYANPIGVMTRISEGDGAPTPFFIQQWNSQLAVNTYVFNEIVAGAGLVGGGSLVNGDVTLSMPPRGTAGTYGSSTEVPVITTDEQGRVVEVTLETITADAALAVEDDGVAFGSFSTFNFVGANWSLTDAGAGELTVSVSESFTGVATEDDGVSVVSSATTFNFTGSGVTVTDAGAGQADIAITGGISGIATEDDGVSVVSSSDTLNFTGAGVAVTDGGGGQTNIAIAGGISGIATEDDGASVVSSAITLNFTGAGVAVTDAGAGQADIAIAGGTSGIATEDDGVSVVASSDTLNFTGAGVVVTDGGGGQTNIAIAGGSGGISGVAVEDDGVSVETEATTFNFTGAGVAVTDAGSGQVDVAIAGGGGGGSGEYTTYALTNPGFEAGDLTGWTQTTSGQWTVSSGSFFGTSGPDTGTYYARTLEPVGAADPLYQDITLSGATNGGEVVEITYSLSWPIGLDLITVTLVFFDASDTEIGRRDHRPFGDDIGSSPWYRYVLTAIMPEDVTKVRVQVDSINREGSRAASAVDSFSSLSVSAAGGASGGVTVSHDYSVETEATTTFNFTGAGVVVTDAGSGQVDVAIAGGGAGKVDVSAFNRLTAEVRADRVFYSLDSADRIGADWFDGLFESDAAAQTASSPLADASNSLVTEAGRTFMRSTAYRIMTERRGRLVRAGKRWKISFLTKLAVDPDPAAGPHIQYLFVSCLTPDGANNGYRTIKVYSGGISVTDGWIERAYTTPDDLIGLSLLGSPTGASIAEGDTFRLVLGFNGFDSNIGGAEQDVAWVQIEEVSGIESINAELTDEVARIDQALLGIIETSGGGATAQWFKGNGYRRHIITATASSAFTGDPNRSLGAVPDNNFYWNGSGTRNLTWDFKEPVNLTGVALVQSSASAMGTWQMSHSTDNVTFTDVGDTFAWGTTATTIHEFANTVEARYWRVTLASGSTSSGPYQHLHLFKLKYASEG